MLSCRRALYPVCQPGQEPPASVRPIAHTIAASDGTTVEVWRLAAETPRGRILLCHGYRADRFQVLGIAAGLRRHGYETLIMELRGHGRRPGPCTLGVREVGDALAVLRWIASSDRLPPLPIGAVGLSMGAAVLCEAARHTSHLQALVTDSAYPRLFPVIASFIWQRHHMPNIPFAWITWWSLHVALRARLARLDPIRVVRHVRQPLLALHGAADQRVPLDAAEAFYRAWAGPKERWVDPQAAHAGLFASDPETYCTRLAAFFNQALASRLAR